MDRPCTSTIRKLLFPQSEEDWACCTPNVVQTLVFYRRLSWLNRHWIDLVHPVSENYFFHSWNYDRPGVQTLVFYSRLSGLNRQWIDAVHPLSEIYFFHIRKKIGPVVYPTLYKRWYFTDSWNYDRPIVQTLVFYSRLSGLNRQWIDLVNPLSENNFFHSRNKVGPIVSEHCTNVGNQQLISYIGPTFNRSSQSAECHDFCLGYRTVT